MHRIKKDALFVIDGSYLMYRSFYAIKTLYTSTGIPTQATFGFCRAIKKLIDQFDPNYFIIVWDSKKRGFRYDIYPEYKGTRQKPPSDLFTQKEYILNFLDAIKLAHITQEGYEGDDVIASLAEKYGDRQVVLVCPDKDMYQLLSDHVIIFDPFKEKIIDPQTFKEENGFEAKKIPFYYALLGDASDNIPGVAGIGKKTAQELVMQFDSLEELYDNLDTIKKERIRKLLEEQKDAAFLSLKLFVLQPPVITTSITETLFDKNNWACAIQLFQELEFGSLVKDIEKRFPHALKKISTKTGEENTSLFGLSPETPKTQKQAVTEYPPRTWELVVVQDTQTFDDMIRYLTKQKVFGLDTETTGPMPLLDDIVGISFAANKQKSYYLPLGHLGEKQLTRQQVLEPLKKLLEDKNVDVIMHHAKFDQLVLRKYGIDSGPIKFDTLLAANLVRNEWQKINLKDLSLFFLNEPMRKFKEILGKKYKTFAQVPISEGAEYAAHDALQTLKIKEPLAQLLNQEPTLKKVFETIEMPFYWVLLRMEEKGILLDADKIKLIAIDVNKELEALEQKILANIHHDRSVGFNLKSPKQIEWLLFDQLNLPVIKKSDKGGRSTDQEVLLELAKVHPIPGLLVRHRELAKLKNTYLEPLPTFINPATGRIHTIYSQTQVATGRLSSADPNMQNIPASQGYGMGIRSAFYAPKDKIFMSADYSQIELRVLAHLSGDPTLINVFLHDLDIHAQTASQLFDVPVDQVTSQQRQLGKRINFSIIYGMSAFGLARDLDIKQSDAKIYIEKYFAQYPKVAEWMNKIVQKAIIDGYVETLYGRRRYIHELREKNKNIFETGKRMAINTPVQGTQADIMKMAMIKINDLLAQKGLEARMILQIHDEIILELPETELEAVQNIVVSQMEGVAHWQIPLKVTIRTGKNWAEVTK